MTIDQDIIQRIKVTGIFCLQFYKVLTGTMMTLFIPQACYEPIGDGSNVIHGDEVVRICTLTQNLENNEIYHRLTLYWNSISFLCFIYCYLLELKRESWAIKFLDVDKDKSYCEIERIGLLVNDDEGEIEDEQIPVRFKVISWR